MPNNAKKKKKLYRNKWDRGSIAYVSKNTCAK